MKEAFLYYHTFRMQNQEKKMELELRKRTNESSTTEITMQDSICSSSVVQPEAWTHSTEGCILLSQGLGQQAGGGQVCPDSTRHGEGPS